MVLHHKLMVLLRDLGEIYSIYSVGWVCWW